MSLANLAVAPTNPTDMSWFSFSNQDHHVLVANAIATSSKFQNQNILIRPLDPIPLGDDKQMEDWLRQHYDEHSDVNEALGIDGADLSTVDFNDQAQLAAWVLLHLSEHQQWQQILQL